MLRHALIVTLLAGCVLPPKTLTSQMRRGPIWAQPGSDRVFAWSFRERTREQSGTVINRRDSEDHLDWETSQYTVIDRIRVSVVDPMTGAATTLEEYEGEVQPLYWNATSGTLWVTDRFGIVTGLTATGKRHPTHGGFTRGGLPLPFLREFPRGDIFDLSTERMIELDKTGGEGHGTVDGSTLRLSRIGEDGYAMKIEQTAIDWSTPTPTRLPDLTFKTPDLLEPGAYREAHTILADGRRFAEVVTRMTGTQLVVHDVVTRQVIANLPVGSLSKPKGQSRSAQLYTLAGDKLLFAVHQDKPGDEGERCLRGFMIALDAAAVTPLPESPCVIGARGTPGRVWLQTTKGSGYVDARARLLSLGALVEKPIAIGPSTIAYALPSERSGVDVESVDLATGVRMSLGHHDTAKDTLLNVMPGMVVFVSGVDEIVTDTPGRPATRIRLPAI